MSVALANAAKLVAEPARAAMLLQLMGGRAVPAGELSVAAHVSPQTASEHLARLTEAGFLTARRQGRHRYYSLANTDVAHAVETLLVLSSVSREGSLVKPAQPAAGSLEHARTCYAHIAGWLGVAITDALQHEGYLLPAAGRALAVTERGRAWFEQRGIAVRCSSEVADRGWRVNVQTGQSDGPIWLGAWAWACTKGSRSLVGSHRHERHARCESRLRAGKPSRNFYMLWWRDGRLSEDAMALSGR